MQAKTAECVQKQQKWSDEWGVWSGEWGVGSGEWGVGTHSSLLGIGVGGGG